MQPRDIHTAIRILKKEVEQWHIPAVGHYTQTPFTVLISVYGAHLLHPVTANPG
jgi:hypothetical protein